MRELSSPEKWKVAPIADEPMVVCSSPDPRKVTVGHPSILALSSGRILVALDYQGPGLGKLKGKKGKVNRNGHWIQGCVMVSTDKGKTWEQKLEYPSGCGQLFASGTNIYLLGYTNGLEIMRSGDGGENWSKSEKLSASAINDTCYEGGLPSLLINDSEAMAVAFNLSDAKAHGEICDLLRPVMLQAKCGTSLNSSKNWTQSSPGPSLPEFLDIQQISALGAPIFNVPEDTRQINVGAGRWAGHPGWSNPHLLRIPDSRHPWQNREKSTLHLLASASMHRSNCAILMRIETYGSTTARFTPQTTPGGSHFSLIPLPGGHLPFDIFYDDKSERFWLISNVADNSMIIPRNLPAKHVGLPCEQRTSLQIQTSRNLVDWTFVALAIEADQSNLISIHEPSAAVCGDNLCIASRASDSDAKNERDSNNIIFTTIPNFRSLIR